MRKTVLLIAIAAFTFFSVKGQEVLNKGDKMMNIGLGLVSSYGFIPSINFSGEVGVIPTGDVGIVSFGGEAEYKMEYYDYYDYWYSESWIKNHFAAGFRAAWHLHVFNNPKYDLYAGASVGFRMITKDTYDVKWNAQDEYYLDYTTHAGVYQTVFFGARIMTSDNFGFFGELAGGYYSISYIKGGITFKL